MGPSVSAAEAKSAALQLYDFGIHLEAALAYIASNLATTRVVGKFDRDLSLWVHGYITSLNTTGGTQMMRGLESQFEPYIPGQ